MIFLKRTIYLIFTAMVIFSSCNESEDVVTENAKEGAFLTIKGSNASLAGAPETGVELEDALIEFEETELTYNVAISAGADDVAELIVKKTFKGQVVEVQRTSESSTLLEYDEMADFLEGFTDITPEGLRIGDVMNFQTTMVMKDGRSLVTPAASFNVSVSCLSDLSGTYTVSNSACAGTFTVVITKNADGSYDLPSADGGFLNRCTANTSLVNAGSIIEQCGEILANDELTYGTGGSGNGIGDITGGTWDAATGTLTMSHKQSFSGNWPSEWTSTYVRQ